MSLTARLASPADAEIITKIYNDGIEDRVGTFETRAHSVGRWRITLCLMATVTFRTDLEVDEALRALTADRGDRSQAIRDAILTTWRLRQAELLREEAEAIASDPEDRAEARAVLSDMQSVRAW